MSAVSPSNTTQGIAGDCNAFRPLKDVAQEIGVTYECLRKLAAEKKIEMREVRRRQCVRAGEAYAYLRKHAKSEKVPHLRAPHGFEAPGAPASTSPNRLDVWRSVRVAWPCMTPQPLGSVAEQLGVPAWPLELLVSRGALEAQRQGGQCLVTPYAAVCALSLALESEPNLCAEPRAPADFEEYEWSHIRPPWECAHRKAARLLDYMSHALGVDFRAMAPGLVFQIMEFLEKDVPDAPCLYAQEPDLARFMRQFEEPSNAPEGHA